MFQSDLSIYLCLLAFIGSVCIIKRYSNVNVRIYAISNESVRSLLAMAS